MQDYSPFWSTQQAFRQLLALVIRQLVQKGRADLQQCFVDATFAAAKGGGEAVGLTREGKGTKIQLVVDAKGIPLAVSLDAVDRAERHMDRWIVERTIADYSPAGKKNLSNFSSFTLLGCLMLTLRHLPFS